MCYSGRTEAAKQQRRGSVLESPWYWLYAFAAAGLIILMLTGDRIERRQAQLQQHYLVREGGDESFAAGDANRVESSAEGVRWLPLYIGPGGSFIKA